MENQGQLDRAGKIYSAMNVIEEAQSELLAARAVWAEYKQFLQEKYPAAEGTLWRFTCPQHIRLDQILSGN